MNKVFLHAHSLAHEGKPCNRSGLSITKKFEIFCPPYSAHYEPRMRRSEVSSKRYRQAVFFIERGPLSVILLLRARKSALLARALPLFWTGTNHPSYRWMDGTKNENNERSEGAFSAYRRQGICTERIRWKPILQSKMKQQ